MKTKPPYRSRSHASACLALLAGCLAAGLMAAHAAPARLQPLIQPGQWPGWPRGGNAQDVKVVGNYAYVALGEAGLAVIDASNPTNCVRVGGCDTTGFARRLEVSGNYAYVADDIAGLQVIDVSNPARCVRVGGVRTGNPSFIMIAYDVAVSGNYAYLGFWYYREDGPAGLLVIDVSNPTNCVIVGGCYAVDGAIGVAVAANYAYMTVLNPNFGFVVFDVNNPTNCAQVFPRPPGHPGQSLLRDSRDVAVSGNFAYVLGVGVELGGDGLHVIDVSSPTNCVRVGGFTNVPHGYASGVAVAGNHAYVADGDAGLQVISVSDPTNCVRVGGTDTSGTAYGVAVSGRFAYVADGEAGLQVIDVRDPTNPARVGGFDIRASATSVAASGHYAYVADGEAGLQVIDVSNPRPAPCA